MFTIRLILLDVLYVLIVLYLRYYHSDQYISESLLFFSEIRPADLVGISSNKSSPGKGKFINVVERIFFTNITLLRGWDDTIESGNNYTLRYNRLEVYFSHFLGKKNGPALHNTN